MSGDNLEKFPPVTTEEYNEAMRVLGSVVDGFMETGMYKHWVHMNRITGQNLSLKNLPSNKGK